MAKILVIDDEELVREHLETALAEEGHQVSTARDGREGMKKFRQDPPQLVIVDILMPEKEGLETIREMHATDASVPIIVMSGGGRAGTLDFFKIAEKFGACASLSKPFSRNKITEAVERVLSSR